MKQGPSSNKTLPKPTSQAYKPDLGAISRMGAKQNMKNKPAACVKLGTSAPKSSATSHPKGSQHK